MSADEKVVGLFGSLPASSSIDKSVPDFLRQWADAIEAGELEADAAVLVVYKDRGAQFQVSHRRCNADAMRTTAMLEIAKVELLTL